MKKGAKSFLELIYFHFSKITKTIFSCIGLNEFFSQKFVFETSFEKVDFQVQEKWISTTLDHRDTNPSHTCSECVW